MSKQYPAPGNWKRQPDKDRDGLPGVGSSCVLCGRNTLGQLFVQVNIFRGDDEVVRLCYADKNRKQEAASTNNRNAGGFE